MNLKVTERQITDLLALRHNTDIFVPQCKDGASGAAGYLRMDAWAMRKSWHHPCYFAYEIKISRSDFLRDNKWQSAMGYCNEFYWVAPSGIIEPTEIAQGCGLITVSKNGTRLFTKKKALYREIEDPIDVLLYILMWRSKIADEYQAKTNLDRWREWLAQKKEAREIGYNVSVGLRTEVERRVKEVERENSILRRALANFEGCQKILVDKKYGHMVKSLRGDVFIPDAPQYGSLERRLNQLQHEIACLSGKMRETAAALDGLFCDDASNTGDAGEEVG